MLASVTHHNLEPQFHPTHTHSSELDTTLSIPDCIVEVLTSNLSVYFR